MWPLLAPEDMHSSALAATFLGLDIDDLAWLPGIPASMSDQIVTDICLPKNCPTKAMRAAQQQALFV